MSPTSRYLLDSRRLVDEQGKPWEIGNSYGRARIKGYPQPSSSFTLSGIYNKHRTKNVQNRRGVSFMPGEGDYASSIMVFPTHNTFVFEGVMAGHTLVSFAPQKEDQVVKRIVYGGEDITHTGLVTKPGEEITDVTIVIGNDS
ncbi:MAG: hypothetical protein ACE5JI_07360 [Acidobacteriota bacterium]